MRTAREVGYRGKVMDLLARAGRLDTSRRDPALLRSEAAAVLGDFVGLDPADFDFRPGGDVHPWSQDNRSGRVAAAMTDGSVAVVDLMTLREETASSPGVRCTISHSRPTACAWQSVPSERRIGRATDRKRSLRA